MLCIYFIMVWCVCSLNCWPTSKLIPPGSDACCACSAYLYRYGWAAGLWRGCAGAGAS